MADSIKALAAAIAAGSSTSKEDIQAAMLGVFENYFQKMGLPITERQRPAFFRVAYGSGGDAKHIPYAGYIFPENPGSGPYGGMSLVWFPKEEQSLLCFGIGTRGLSPDEGILMRPGHARRIQSLRRRLRSQGVSLTWAKRNIADQGSRVPESIFGEDATYDDVLARYGNVLYLTAEVESSKPEQAVETLRAFLDLYGYERRWKPRSGVRDRHAAFISELESAALATANEEEVAKLLQERRFVVLQGPPGTGKTRMAQNILKSDAYGGNGNITQFHPSTTYEDFIIGLSPKIGGEKLGFEVKEGHLLKAAKLAADGKPALLVIDEINRGDLGRVLGEAIYLFEAGDEARSVDLPYSIGESKTFTLPKNLHVLATMNTADRSIASMDVAIRRRFAFVTMMPERSVVEAEGNSMALTLFDALSRVFIEYAPDDALALMPGHSYFLAKQGDEEALKTGFKHQLIPLLDEYLREGILGQANSALHAVRNQIEDYAESSNS